MKDNPFYTFQKEIADALNGDPWFIERRCAAIAEDEGDTNTAIDTKITQDRGIAMTVRTPGGKFLGDEGADTVRISADPLQILISEIPAINRLEPGHTTALGCLARLIHALRDDGWGFIGYRKHDLPGGEIGVTADFRTTFPVRDPTAPELPANH